MRKSVGLVIASLLCVWVVSDWWPALFQPATATRASETQAVPERRHRPDVPLDRPVPVLTDYTDHMDSTDRMDHADVLQLNQHLISIADKVRPTVVNISVTRTVSDRHPFFNSPFFDDPFFRRFFGERFQEERRRPPRRQRQGTGSGVIVSADGYIVTNNHVVAEDSTIQVVLDDKRTFEAELVGTDPKTDLAIVKIDASGLPFLSWGDSSQLHVGEMVIAVGNPFGLNQTVTMGIISAVGRANVGIVDYEDFIQTDAPINPGNSGGPLVNMAGEIVGINTAILSRTGGSEGVGLAIPVGIAKDITNSLITTGRVVRGWMGIAIQELTPALAQSFQLPESHTSGVLISEVNAQGPSAGNLQRGDVLLEYRGEKIRDINHLRHIVARTMVGTGVDVTILRDGLVQTLTVTVGERPTDAMLALGGQASPPSATGEIDNVLAGLDVGPLRREDRTRLNLSDEMTGVIIRGVETGSEAEAAGLQPDDVIQEVDRKMVSSVADYQQIASKIAREELVVLFINRRGNNLFIAVNPQ